MIFREAELAGVFEVDLEPHKDERGFFARSWCRQEFEDRGLNANLAQCSISFNARKGTLRGMHYQELPHGEAKLVRCTKGAIYDVVLDLRPQSPMFTKWAAFTLTERNRKMVYVPEGCAHGFLTMEGDTEIFYQMTEFYHPESARGVRWDDPAFQISWPSEVKLISERDRTYPDFKALPCFC